MLLTYIMMANMETKFIEINACLNDLKKGCDADKAVLRLEALLRQHYHDLDEAFLPNLFQGMRIFLKDGGEVMEDSYNAYLSVFEHYKMKDRERIGHYDLYRKNSKRSTIITFSNNRLKLFLYFNQVEERKSLGELLLNPGFELSCLPDSLIPADFLNLMDANSYSFLGSLDGFELEKVLRADTPLEAFSLLGYLPFAKRIYSRKQDNSPQVI